MQKKLIIISGIFVVVATILYGMTLFSQKKNSQDNAASSQQTNDVTQGSLLVGEDIPTAPLIRPNISTELRERISTVLLPTWKPLGGNQYLAAEVPTLEAPSMIPDFTITYGHENSAFTITLYSDPLLENRQKAAELLKSMLNIENEEACQLDVQVVIPRSINVNYAQKNLKLPFCPGFTDLKGVRADQGVSNIDPDVPDKDPNAFVL